MQDRIASGGMASVHIGRILGPGGFTKIVAIKHLHEHLAADPEFAKMFLDEARLTAIVQHANVVSTIDVVADQGDVFLVMEYVLGDSLANLIREARRLGEGIPLPIVTAVMSGALNGLHAAHDACTDRGEPMGIVHRDVSPQNLIVGADGITRVADFGIAKAAARMHSTIGRELKGKFAYMAPEQLRRETVDRRTDVYSAGVVLWEMTTSKRLVSGDDPAALVSAVLAGAFSPPSTYRADVPPELDAVVSRALALDPADRYPTALDFVAHLEVAVPPASSREVAAWVAAVAGQKLGERRKLMVDMPTSSGVMEVQRAVPAQVDTPAPTPAPAPPLPTLVLKEPRTGGWIWMGGIALLAIVGIAAASALGVSMFRRATVAPRPSQGLPVASDVTIAISVPSAPLPADTQPVPEQTAEAPQPSVPSHARPNRGGRTAPQRQPVQPPQPNCNPPFTVDGDGVKRFKPDCF